MNQAALATALAKAALTVHAAARSHKRAAEAHRRAARNLMRTYDGLRREAERLGVYIDPDDAKPQKEAQR